MTIYEHHENEVGWNTWQRHFNHHLKTVYGVDAQEAGIYTGWLHNDLFASSGRTPGESYWFHS